MFVNPDTMGRGFLDAFADYPEMRYILILQESIAVLITDGYARSTQWLALAQLHISPGISNAVGALYQARRGIPPSLLLGVMPV
ncbi:thiamine pyrophosphate-binding protein [Candidatus Latescibacterota bacterium]